MSTFRVQTENGDYLNTNDPYGGTFSVKQAKRDGRSIDFPTRPDAERALALRCSRYGKPISKYKILEIQGSVFALDPADVRMRANAHCATCKEPFPYDPMPSNRKDGGTDCYRCKVFNREFG